MAEIVLHIGAHKCATTSVQDALDQKHGPGRLIRVRGKMEPIQDSLVQLGEPKPLPVDAALDCIRTMLRDHPGLDRYVISNENILGRMLGLDWAFYPNAAHVRDFLDRVAEEAHLTVLLQTREPASLLRSSYYFRKHKGLVEDYGQFLDRLALEDLSWHGLLRTLFDEARFDWQVLPVDWLRDPAHARAKRAFFRALDPDWDIEAAPLPRSNESRDVVLTAFLEVVAPMGVKIPRHALFAQTDKMRRLPQEPHAPRLESIMAFARQLGIGPGPRIRKATAQRLERLTADAHNIDRLLRRYYAADYAKALAYAAGVAPETAAV